MTELTAEGQRLIEAGRFDEAMTLLERRAAQDPATRHLYGIAAYRAGDLESAERAFRMNVLAPHPHAVHLYSLGLVLQKKDSSAEAIQWYEAALAEDPGLIDAQKRLDTLRPLTRTSTSPPPAAPPRPTPPMPRSQFNLVEQDQLGTYITDSRAKAQADFKTGAWYQFPPWLRAVMLSFTIVVAAGLLAVMAYSVVQFVTYEQRVNQRNEQQQEEIQDRTREAHVRFCQGAREQGFEPSGCEDVPISE